MKQCPICYSQNVKEYKRCGVMELKCHNCQYDSGDKYHGHKEGEKVAKEKAR